MSSALLKLFCKKKKKSKNRKLIPITPYVDAFRLVGSEISIESTRQLNDVLGGKFEEKLLSLQSQMKDCTEQKAENEVSTLSMESDPHHHEASSSEPSAEKHEDSLSNIKTILSYSVLHSSSDTEEEGSKPVEENSAKMESVDEDSESAECSEILVERSKVGNTSIDITHTTVGSNISVEKQTEFGVTGILGDNLPLTAVQNSSETSSFSELTQIVYEKETTSGNVNIVQEDEKEKDAFIEKHVGPIASLQNNSFGIDHVKPPTDIENVEAKVIENSTNFKVKEVKSGIEIMTVSIKSIKSKDSTLNSSINNTEMTKFSIFDSIDSFSGDEVDEVTLIDFELSKAVETAISMSSLLVESQRKKEVDDNCVKELGLGRGCSISSEDLCRSANESEIDTEEVYSDSLEKEMQDSTNLELQENLFANDKYNINFEISVPDSDTEDNLCCRLGDGFEKDARKNEVTHLTNEKQLKTVDDSTALTNIAERSVNLDTASEIINQVIGDLLSKNLQDTPKSNYEENLAGNFDCCGDFVLAIPDSPVAKEIPCRLAAALENDPAQALSNVPELLNPNKIDISKQIYTNVEQRKWSRAKRPRNALLNALKLVNVYQDLMKTDDSNDDLEGIMDESEDSMYDEKLFSINECSDFCNAETQPAISKYEEFIGIALVCKDGELKPDRPTQNTLTTSKKVQSLFPKTHEICSEHNIPFESTVGDYTSSLCTKTADEEDYCPRSKCSNYNVNIPLYEDKVGQTYGNAGNDKSYKIASKVLCATDRKKKSLSPDQMDNITDILKDENLHVEEVSNKEILVKQPHVQNNSERTAIEEGNKVFEVLSECLINRDDIRVQIRKIISKAVDILHKTKVKNLGYKESIKSLEPKSKSTSTIKKQREVSKNLSSSPDNGTRLSYFTNEPYTIMKDLFVYYINTDRNSEYRLPYEKLDFKENTEEFTFAQESTSCTSSSSTIPKLAMKHLESHKRIVGHEQEADSSSSSRNDSRDNILSKCINSHSTNNCIRDYMNFEVLNGADKRKKLIQDGINATNNRQFVLSEGYDPLTGPCIDKGEDYSLRHANENIQACFFEQRETVTFGNTCPASRPSEQGDIKDTESDTYANLTAEANAAFGDITVDNCYLHDLKNCEVPTFDVSSADVIPKIPTKKDVSSQITIQLNPMRRNLVLKCSGKFEVVPDEAILSTGGTSRESVSIICPSESPVEKLKHFQKTIKNANFFDDKKIENEYKKSLDLFNVHKSEAFKPMKQPSRVLPFPNPKSKPKPVKQATRIPTFLKVKGVPSSKYTKNSSLPESVQILEGKVNGLHCKFDKKIKK